MPSRDNPDFPDRESAAELLLALAHDCSNLLAVAELGARNAARALTPGSRASRDLQTVRDVINRMGVMLQRIRAFARPHASAPEPLNLNDLVRYVSSLLAPILGDPAGPRLNLDPALPVVEADRLELEQVLMNLLLNASQAASPQGKVAVETRTLVLDRPRTGSRAPVATGVYAQLAVSDTGRGMSEEALAHVFEPFFTTKAPGEGSGLGLAGSRRIVERCGGSIFIESAPHQGTRVEVLLPARTSGSLNQPWRLQSSSPQTPSARVQQ